MDRLPRIKQNVQDFPRLTRMTKQYLSVPATSVSPETLQQSGTRKE